MPPQTRHTCCGPVRDSPCVQYGAWTLKEQALVFYPTQLSRIDAADSSNFSSRRRISRHHHPGPVAQPTGRIASGHAESVAGGAPYRGENEHLPPFRMFVLLDQRAARRQQRSRHARTRSARWAERQDQDDDGEKYAAYWKNSKNRQHRFCLTESGKRPKPVPSASMRRIARMASPGRARSTYDESAAASSGRAVTAVAAIARKQ